MKQSHLPQNNSIGAEKPKTGMIGGKIRELRKSTSMTLKQLSAKTSLSVGYISQIERNLSSPTLKVMLDISRVFKVNISFFFQDNKAKGNDAEEYILRHHQRRNISFEPGIDDCLLNTGAVKKLQVLLSTFQPGASMDEGYCHEGEECGIILAGNLELWIDEELFVLGQNDSFSFPSTKVHRYRNPGITQTVVIWAMTPPSY
ncbi:MAG: Cro/Cl family transcriptional regulator [Alphaproteobacteria bacterium]|nr:MAG: Cro/Cl family transcriptional regulator [Alphaproteobacteria bacterium]